MKSILVSFVALGLLACASKGGMSGDDVGSGDDSVSAADKQQDYDDVASAVGANTQGVQLAAMIDVVGIAYVHVPPGFQEIAPNELLGSHGGVQYHYSWYCRDAVDQVDIACDGLENHVHLQVDFTGQLAASGMTLTGFDRTAKWTVRDVSVNRPRVDGTGHVSFSTELATGSYTLDYDDAFTRVRFIPTPTVPSAGTMDLMITVNRTRDGVHRAFATAAHLDFTTTPATLVFDGTASYKFDMSTGMVTSVP